MSIARFYGDILDEPDRAEPPFLESVRITLLVHATIASLGAIAAGEAIHTLFHWFSEKYWNIFLEHDPQRRKQ